MDQGKLLEMVRSLCERVFCTWYYTIGHNWHHSEKLCFEPSQIATVTNCDTTVAICDSSQFVIKAVTAQTAPNSTENLFCVLGRVPTFTFDMNMKTYIFAHSGVISLVYLFVCMHISYKAHNRCTKETFLIGSDVDVNMFSALRSIPSVTMKSIWEVVFWTVTNCNNHKLRHYRRNLWFVAICDQSRDGANWVQQHWKRVLWTWESTHAHFWHEYENLHFCQFWCYFTGISVCVYV